MSQYQKDINFSVKSNNSFSDKNKSNNNFSNNNFSDKNKSNNNFSDKNKSNKLHKNLSKSSHIILWATISAIVLLAVIILISFCLNCYNTNKLNENEKIILQNWKI